MNIQPTSLRFHVHISTHRKHALPSDRLKGQLGRSTVKNKSMLKTINLGFFQEIYHKHKAPFCIQIYLTRIVKNPKYSAAS